MHSLNYVAQSGQKRREGEVDFLLIHPKVGIIALEAKGDAEVSNWSGRVGISRESQGRMAH